MQDLGAGAWSGLSWRTGMAVWSAAAVAGAVSASQFLLFRDRATAASSRTGRSHEELDHVDHTGFWTDLCVRAAPGAGRCFGSGARPAFCWLPRALFKTPGLAGAAAGSCGERVLWAQHSLGVAGVVRAAQPRSLGIVTTRNRLSQ